MRESRTDSRDIYIYICIVTNYLVPPNEVAAAVGKKGGVPVVRSTRIERHSGMLDLVRGTSTSILE